MGMYNAVSLGALLLMGVILLVLVAQCLRIHCIWRMLNQWDITKQSSLEILSCLEQENRELRSGLRAEKAHVEQLQRKLVLLQALVPAA